MSSLRDDGLDASWILLTHLGNDGDTATAPLLASVWELGERSNEHPVRGIVDAAGGVNPCVNATHPDNNDDGDAARINIIHAEDVTNMARSLREITILMKTCQEKEAT